MRVFKKYNYTSGFITIFVSVVLTCIIAIILVLTEGARMRASKLYYRIANNCAIDSMFSLYHLPLWKYYHLLGIEFKDEIMLKDEFYNYLKVHSEDENGKLYDNWFPAKLMKDKIVLSQEQLIYKTNLISEICDFTKLALLGKSIDFIATKIDISNESDLEKMGDVIKYAFKSVTDTSAMESKKLASISKEYSMEKELSSLNILLTNISKTIKNANNEITTIRSCTSYTSFNVHAKTLLSNINSIYQSVNVFLNELKATDEKLKKLIEKFQIDKLSLSNDGITIVSNQLQSYKDALDNCLSKNGIIDTINSEASDLKDFLNSIIEEIEDFIESIKDLEGSEKTAAKKEFNKYIKEVAKDIEYLTNFDFDQKINETEKNKYTNLIDLINNNLVNYILSQSSDIPKISISYNDPPLSEISEDTSLLEKVLLNEYSFEHLNYYNKMQIDKTKAYSSSKRYEIEYLLSGKSSDFDAVKECINELFLIRSGLNLIYLYTDSASRQEALSLASTIAPAAPLLVPVIQFSLLFAWSSAQSIVDLRTLYNCGRVPIMHTSDTFTLSISNVLDVLTMENEFSSDSGLNYKDYLRILLYTRCLLDQKEIYKRLINIIEYNIKNNMPNKDELQDNFNFNNLSYKLDTSSTYETHYIFSNLNFLNMFPFSKWKGTYEIKIETTNSYANSILKGN